MSDCELLQMSSRNGRHRPGQNFRIAMFADDVGMNVLRVHPETTSQQRTEACSIEHCARADNASGWHSSGCGEMRRKMRHDVYGVRYDHQDRVTCMFQNRRYHLLKDCGVPLE